MFRVTNLILVVSYIIFQFVVVFNYLLLLTEIKVGSAVIEG